MAGLLVSVRSLAEARAALAGGAALIDVKEPARGSLGRADDETIAAVVDFAAKYLPVSAALGELLDGDMGSPRPGLSYVKWGLAGCGRRGEWRQELLRARTQLQRTSPSCRPVAVAYADWQRANAPSVQEVIAVACRDGFNTVLLDTWCKDGGTLLDRLSLAEVLGLCSACRAAGIRVALAGNLSSREIERLRNTQPTWFAVRSAVCRGRNRQQPIDREAVRELVDCVASRYHRESGVRPES
jgi:(5-formylfuran-3-yl)methyl phosphate synthase